MLAMQYKDHPTKHSIIVTIHTPSAMTNVKHRRNFTAKEKLRAVELADQLGLRPASRQLQCSHTVLRKWKQQQEQLQDQNPSSKRLPGAGRKLQSTEVNAAVYQWFEEQRGMQHGVSPLMLRMRAKLIAKRLGIPMFRCGRGWYECFRMQYSVSLRARTTISHSLPAPP